MNKCLNNKLEIIDELDNQEKKTLIGKFYF